MKFELIFFIFQLLNGSTEKDLFIAICPHLFTSVPVTFGIRSARVKNIPLMSLNFFEYLLSGYQNKMS